MAAKSSKEGNGVGGGALMRRRRRQTVEVRGSNGVEVGLVTMTTKGRTTKSMELGGRVVEKI